MFGFWLSVIGTENELSAVKEYLLEQASSEARDKSWYVCIDEQWHLRARTHVHKDQRTYQHNACPKRCLPFSYAL